MRTEQDYPTIREDPITVWTRYRDEPVVDIRYSDERPGKLEVIVSLAMVCVILGVVIYFCLPLLGVGQ